METSLGWGDPCHGFAGSGHAKMPYCLLFQVAHDVAQAIHGCAQKGIAQRDTTERNMGYDENGRGCLLDFSAGKVCVHWAPHPCSVDAQWHLLSGGCTPLTSSDTISAHTIVRAVAAPAGMLCLA